MVAQGTGPNTSCCLPSLWSSSRNDNLTKSSIVVGLQVEPTAVYYPPSSPPPSPTHTEAEKAEPRGSERLGFRQKWNRSKGETGGKLLSLWGLMVLQGTSPRWLTEFSALAIGLASLRNFRAWQAFTYTFNCLGLVMPPACYRVQITRHTFQSHLKNQHSATRHT